MRKLMPCVAGGLLAITLAGGPAWGQATTTTTTYTTATTQKETATSSESTSSASTKPTSTKPTFTKPTSSNRLHGWRVVAGVFRTRSAAEKRLADLQAKSITGFKVLAIHPGKPKTRYEVEEMFSSHKAAKAAAAKLRADGFTVKIRAV